MTHSSSDLKWGDGSLPSYLPMLITLRRALQTDHADDVIRYMVGSIGNYYGNEFTSTKQAIRVMDLGASDNTVRLPPPTSPVVPSSPLFCHLPKSPLKRGQQSSKERGQHVAPVTSADGCSSSMTSHNGLPDVQPDCTRPDDGTVQRWAVLVVDLRIYCRDSSPGHADRQRSWIRRGFL